MDSSSNYLNVDDSWISFVEERLSAGQVVRYLSFRGVSMRPMLRQGKDSVELSPLPEKIKKFDLPVYRRSDGKYVMHRVIAVKDDHYICLGDNTVGLEKVYPEQMIGVMSAFKRGAKRVEADALGYRMYCRIWRLTHPFRKLLYKSKKRAYRWIKLLYKEKNR